MQRVLDPMGEGRITSEAILLLAKNVMSGTFKAPTEAAPSAKAGPSAAEMSAEAAEKLAEAAGKLLATLFDDGPRAGVQVRCEQQGGKGRRAKRGGGFEGEKS